MALVDALGRLRLSNCCSSDITRKCSLDAAGPTALSRTSQKVDSALRSPTSSSSWSCCNSNARSRLKSTPPTVLSSTFSCVPDHKVKPSCRISDSVFRQGLRWLGIDKRLDHFVAVGSSCSTSLLHTSGLNSNGQLLRCGRMFYGRSIAAGWGPGEMFGGCRNFFFGHTGSCRNSPRARQYTLHRVECSAYGRKHLVGSFLGNQIMEEPWSWISDGFVFKTRNGGRTDRARSDGELSRGLLRKRGGHGASNVPRLHRIDAPQSQPLTSARPRRGINQEESLPRRILRNCIPQSHDTPPKRDTGIASEKDWGINLKNELTSESGVNEDGSTWYRESGEDLGDNGYRCRWTVMGGKNAEGSSEWKEAWWEKSDWTGYKELGAEKSGRNAQGDTWWETWQEVLRQDDWSNLARIEKSAQKQAKSGSGSAGWYEKWWEKYNAKGWSEKGAHKYGRLNDQGWWEKWGEQYDGRGAVLKWTDKWAETDMGTKWGDKWEEKFNQGIGTRQGETWHYSANGERWSRTWGEEHVGTGKVHKYGKSTSGESWDSVVEEGTFYQAEPHYGWADAVGNSIQLLAIETLERPPGIYPDLDLGMPPPQA